MTANAFASLSLDPLLVLVCVQREAVMREVVEEVGTFAVSVLAADQEPLARWFSDPTRPPGMAQFDPVAWSAGPVTAAPLISEALAWLECQVENSYEGGDHEIFIGRVLSLARAERRDPLLYFGGGYHRLDGAASPAGLRPIHADRLDLAEQRER
jgi:flavin reductase (DIM6/NTAB) family NADH-FMN oxidoreductase RutF